MLIFNSPLSKNDTKILQYFTKNLIAQRNRLPENIFFKLWRPKFVASLNFMFNMKHHKCHITYLIYSKYTYYKFTEAISDKSINVNS